MLFPLSLIMKLEEIIKIKIMSMLKHVISNPNSIGLEQLNSQDAIKILFPCMSKFMCIFYCPVWVTIVSPTSNFLRYFKFLDLVLLCVPFV